MTLRDRVVRLRQEGKTYGEIQAILDKRIAKSTLSYWCRTIVLPDDYQKRVRALILKGLSKSRATALLKKQEIKEKHHEELVKKYGPLKKLMSDRDVALIALSMLCLGEASKTNNLYLGSSDVRIIKLFLGLLQKCFPYDLEKVRCTIQCRADQDILELEEYWVRESGIPKRLFYKTRIDPRTVGKPTLRREYRGVLKVSYFSSEIQKTLKVLYNLLAETA
jgi:hypothetical protein